MDIEYLLWLQNFREASGDFLTPFVRATNDFTIGTMLLIPVFVYWCLNKRSGMFMLLSLNIGMFLDNMLKMTFCVYRPFMIDERITPLKRARGYSFPSGHAVMSSSIFGGIAYMTKARIITLLCAVEIAFVAFSRNYSGVHTPQDVIAGIILGLATMWAVSRMMSRPERENMFMLLGILAVIAGLSYVSLKSYPSDMGRDGKLIVDYVSKINEPYIYGGILTAIIAGRLVERRFIRFKPAGLNVKGIAVSCAGLGLYYALYFTLKDYCIGLLTPLVTEWGGTFVHAFVSVFFAVAVWPFVIKIFCGGAER
ncbi:MAG: phosphatase PAP2 family protein [Synergistaceae bacterium]|nr:phosphatase PAP2 family protein [Synergistaceae bacterium]